MHDTFVVEEIQHPEPDDTVLVVIPPKGEILRRDRRNLQRGAFIKFCVAADEESGTPPTSFNQSTLQWALLSADAVVIWSGQVPSEAKRIRAAQQLMHDFFAPHMRRGGRIAVINVLHQHADEWLSYTREACRPNIPIRLIANMPEAK
jgi:hypothetical protein